MPPLQTSDVTFGSITADTTAADITTVTVNEAEGVVFFIGTTISASGVPTFSFEHPDDTAVTVNMAFMEQSAADWQMSQVSSRAGQANQTLIVIAMIKPTQTGEYAIQGRTSTSTATMKAMGLWVR